MNKNLMRKSLYHIFIKISSFHKKGIKKKFQNIIILILYFKILNLMNYKLYVIVIWTLCIERTSEKKSNSFRSFDQHRCRSNQVGNERYREQIKSDIHHLWMKDLHVLFPYRSANLIVDAFKNLCNTYPTN